MLPKLQIAEFKTKLPSSGKDVYYRPFLVKEEKILLMALEGGDSEEIENAIISILTNCVRLDEEVINQLPYFDIEYLFLQLRSKSIDNIVRLTLKHKDGNECKHVTDYELNLDDIKVNFLEDHSNRIMITDNVGVVMKYPSLASSSQMQEKLSSSNVDNIFMFLAENIDYVFDDSEVYENATIEEKMTFIEGVSKQQFDKIMSFYHTMPQVEHTITYTCDACSEEEEIFLKGLSSFFM
jgi:hypothetical protein